MADYQRLNQRHSLDAIMTMQEVAQVLKLPDVAVVALAVSGDLPAFRIAGEWRIRGRDFEAWLDSLATSRRRISVPRASHRFDKTEPMERGEGGTLDKDHLDTAVPPLTLRVSQEEMHQRFVSALGARVKHHSSFDSKPLEVDIGLPTPMKTRVYMFNATRPPGGRPTGEHKVQLIVPGQKRGQRGSFNDHDERVVLLVGYAAEEDVFVLWDAGLYIDFAWSRNVQVKGETIIEASAGQLATQVRQLRPGDGVAALETLVAANPERLGEALEMRLRLTQQRLAGE